MHATVSIPLSAQVWSVLSVLSCVCSVWSAVQNLKVMLAGLVYVSIHVLTCMHVSQATEQHVCQLCLHTNKASRNH